MAKLELLYHRNVKKASKQRALTHLSGMLNVENMFLILNILMVSRFMYCPLIRELQVVQSATW